MIPMEDSSERGLLSSEAQQVLAEEIMPMRLPNSSAADNIKPKGGAFGYGAALPPRPWSQQKGNDKVQQNKKSLEKKEAWRTLTAQCPPPTLTCQSWSIVETNSGEVIGRHHDLRRLPMASLTKMACACVVLEIAARCMEKVRATQNERGFEPLTRLKKAYTYLTVPCSRRILRACLRC